MPINQETAQAVATDLDTLVGDTKAQLEVVNKLVRKASLNISETTELASELIDNITNQLTHLKNLTESIKRLG